jgi:hypothetical protein
MSMIKSACEPATNAESSPVAPRAMAALFATICPAM